MGTTIYDMNCIMEKRQLQFYASLLNIFLYKDSIDKETITSYLSLDVAFFFKNTEE